MGRITRRLDGDAREVEPGRQRALVGERPQGLGDFSVEIAVEIHIRAAGGANRRRCSSKAKLSVMPAI